jgi:twinkle protein
VEHEESTLLFKGPCDECGSSDANAHYSDGHTYCFANGCKGRHDGEETTYKRKTVAADLDFYVEADVQGLPARGISEKVCRFFGVRVGKLGGKTVHMYPYHKDGQVAAVKTRGADKDFKFLGDAKHPPMFGQNLFNGGKKIVVCEGEVDAMTLAQLQDCKWPVVSVPNGAQGAKKLS